MRWLVLLSLTGCSALSPVPVCTTPEADLAPGLTCTDAEIAARYVGLLGGRRVHTGRRDILLREIAAHHAADPADTRANLDAMKAIVVEVGGLAGMAAAEKRSTHVFEALSGQGPLDFETYPNSRAVLENRLAPWATDGAEKLVLTETDIEGWISYASLCREAQGAGPISLSIANRELLYREVKRKFVDAKRDEKIALASMGGVWHQVEDRWVAASYEQQQAWIKAAPLPPPMTATSMGYVGTVFEMDLTPHATTLHETLGPFKPKIP